MSSIFTRMLEGQEPARFIWTDERFVAIVSNTPIKPGHCIVFPRQEVENWLALPPELQSHLLDACRIVGDAIQRVHQPVRVGLAIVSVVVKHVHVHLVPLTEARELNFAMQDPHARAEDLDASAERLRRAIAESARP